jgi:hypothetical protein
MRGTIAFVIVCAAGCGGPKGGGGDAEKPAPAKLCVDTKAPGGTSLQLTREGQPGLVQDGDDKGAGKADGPGRVAYAVVEQDAGGPAIAVSAGENCGAQPCNPQIVRVDNGTVTARAPLPHGDEIQAGSDYPFFVDWLSLEDGDGDGAVEAWVSYQIVSPPEAGVGSTTDEHVAVYSLPDLTLRFEAQYAESPEAGSLPRCDGELWLADANCDGAADLVLTQTCGFGYCFEWWENAESSDGEDHTADCGAAPEITGDAYLRQSDGTYAK